MLAACVIVIAFEACANYVAFEASVAFEQAS